MTEFAQVARPQPPLLIQRSLMLIQRLPWRVQQMITRVLLPRSASLSQAGQDEWVFGEVFNEMGSGFFLDIGAHDGVTISNTFLLEWRYGWRGICVEANPQSFRKLTQARRSTCVNVCLDRARGHVEFAVRDVLGGIVGEGMDNTGTEGSTVLRLEALPLKDVLTSHSAPSRIDYLSIDVEGAEDRVLDAFDFDSYRFNCMTIERPSESLRAIFHRHGYVLVKEIVGLDCFYVHSDFVASYKKNLFEYYDKKHLRVRWS